MGAHTPWRSTLLTVAISFLSAVKVAEGCSLVRPSAPTASNQCAAPPPAAALWRSSTAYLHTYHTFPSGGWITAVTGDE